MISPRAAWQPHFGTEIVIETPNKTQAQRTSSVAFLSASAAAMEIIYVTLSIFVGQMSLASSLFDISFLVRFKAQLNPRIL